jgi:hypothetical protein
MFGFFSEVVCSIDLLFMPWCHTVLLTEELSHILIFGKVIVIITVFIFPEFS